MASTATFPETSAITTTTSATFTNTSPTTIASGSSCPPGYALGSGGDFYSCYKTPNGIMAYGDAFAACRSEGAYLVMMKNNDQYQSVLNMIKNSKGNFTICNSSITIYTQ